MKANAHVVNNTQIGKFLDTNGDAIKDSLGVNNLGNVDVIETDKGAVFRYDNGTIVRTTEVTHDAIKRAIRDAHVAEALAPHTHLPSMFPVGTNVTTDFGAGWVHRVTHQSIGVTLPSGTIAYEREEILQGRVAVQKDEE